MYVHMYVCMYVCTVYVCMNAMYVCMYVYDLVYHIHIISFSSYNGGKLNSMLFIWFQLGFIAQLVAHCTGIKEGMGMNPVEASAFFLRLQLWGSLSLVRPVLLRHDHYWYQKKHCTCLNSSHHLTAMMIMMSHQGILWNSSLLMVYAPVK